VTPPAAWRLEVHATLPSTADLCASRAEVGEPEGLAILALRQTAGRGTRGRTWEGAAGGLFLSVLLRPDGPAREASQWSLLAGVALAEALAAYLPDTAHLALKWPNDVLLHGAKLAGILLECASDAGDRLSWLSLGMGANLAVAPRVAERATASLAEHGPPPAPEAVARQVLEALSRWRAVHARAGFAPVRAAFLARAPARGTPITLHLGERTLGGAFAGLGEDGSLLLSAGGRVQSFAAGEVTIGNTP
jgi:BirA family biotin operon repressor/biotin-[acetyl-CoA-carboxylase] ligase